MRQGARQGAPASRTERCRQKERSVHSVRFCLLPYEIIKKTTHKAQSVLGKRACAIGVSVVNYFETETNSGRGTPLERPATKRRTWWRWNCRQTTDAMTPFPAEFYARICGKMSPIYAYGYENSLHKLPFRPAGFWGSTGWRNALKTKILSQ